ncbi:MAG: hypothetical protein Kow0029_04100 [Candidatus Rifleibacteriota bacterium]
MYKITEEGQSLIITIEDSTYPDNCAELKSCYNEALSRKSEKVLLDISAVNVIYSSGITELVQFFTQLKSSNRKLVLVGAQEGVFKIFKLLGLHQLFAFASNLEEAKNI